MWESSERDGKLKRDAISAFEEHQIRHRDERMYLLQRPHKNGLWESNFSVEVFCGWHGTIYVGGDIDATVYAYGPTDVRARIAWIGGTEDVGYYVAQKASIGSGRFGSESEFDREEAISELRDMLRSFKEEYKEEHELDEDCDFYDDHPGVAGMFNGLIRRISDDRIQDSGHLYCELSDAVDMIDPHDIHGYHGQFVEERYDIGSVVAPHVYYSWAALRKLHHLLLEEEKDHGVVGRSTEV